MAKGFVFSAVALLLAESCHGFSLSPSAPQLLSSSGFKGAASLPGLRTQAARRSAPQPLSTRRTRALSTLVMQRGPELKDEELTQMEMELKDSQGWIGYVAPRPIRKVLWGALAANSFWGALILFGSSSASQQAAPLDKVAQNLVFAGAFALLFFNEFRDQASRTERRTKLRKKQIEIGDREVFQKYDEASGRTRTFSRLKPVDDSWILRRIDRWGVVETYESGGNPLPTVGPAKGAILEQLVEEKKPSFILDIGSFVGYAAIRMARKQPLGGLTVTIEKDLRWHLSSKRFVWQSKLWQQYPWEEQPERKVECWYGDALERIEEVAETYGPADMVLIDANTKEYRDYLSKLEESGVLKPGTVVIADNTGLFKDFPGLGLRELSTVFCDLGLMFQPVGSSDPWPHGSSGNSTTWDWLSLFSYSTGSQSLSAQPLVPGVKEYLQYVRTSDRWKSESIQTTLEYRDDTPDEMEMSEYLGPINQ